METKLNKTDVDKSCELLKRTVSISIRVIVSILVLYFIFSLVQWQNVINAYKSADIRFIIIASLLLFVNISIRTFKWRNMLCSVKDSPTFKEAFGSVMLGISLGSFTPGEIGDFAGRALHITDAKRSHLVGLTILDKTQIFIVTSCAGDFEFCMYHIKQSIINCISIDSHIDSHRRHHHAHGNHCDNWPPY